MSKKDLTDDDLVSDIINETTLTKAVKRDDYDLLKFLLEFAAKQEKDINANFKLINIRPRPRPTFPVNHDTPLVLAMKRNNPKLVKLLLDNGADLSFDYFKAGSVLKVVFDDNYPSTNDNYHQTLPALK